METALENVPPLPRRRSWLWTAEGLVKY